MISTAAPDYPTLRDAILGLTLQVTVEEVDEWTNKVTRKVSSRSWPWPWSVADIDQYTRHANARKAELAS